MRTDPHIAVVDGASFVLPYDHGLVGGLVRRGWRVTLFASRTRYNADFLEALRTMQGVEVVDRAVSRTAAPRWQGLLAYAGMWWQIWRRRHEFDAVNLQFSLLWPLELPLLWLLRRRLVFTVHNPVPHDWPQPRHRPTGWIARLARRLVFVSSASRADFLHRYGPQFAARSQVLDHGLVPVAPGDAPRAYGPAAQPQALVFWGNVMPYKGVDLFQALARSPAFQALGIGLEVHGAFAPGLAGLRDALRSLGVRVEDGFLDGAGLRALLARDVVFLLPYRSATQSGALYTLLHQGCRFVCSDVGDLGAFMRRHGLQDLLLAERSAHAVLACLARLQADGPALTAAFAAAQQRSHWDLALADAAAAYGVSENRPR